MDFLSEIRAKIDNIDPDKSPNEFRVLMGFLKFILDIYSTLLREFPDLLLLFEPPSLSDKEKVERLIVWEFPKAESAYPFLKVIFFRASSSSSASVFATKLILSRPVPEFCLWVFPVKYDSPSEDVCSYEFSLLKEGLLSDITTFFKNDSSSF